MVIKRVSTAVECAEIVAKWRSEDLKVGFVPTMGALHAGHLELVKRSSEENETTVVSIFVNPTQFNQSNDFAKYPRDEEADITKLEEMGVDMVFLPSEREMYPDGKKLVHQYDLNGLDAILEGSHRPGHFQGVAQVVDRLLSLVAPDNLYLGIKDYQQVMVIRAMAKIKYPSLRISSVPTMREPDGLAMSSRNLRLNKTERSEAVSIHTAFKMVQAQWREHGIESAIDLARAYLEQVDSFHDIEYFGAFHRTSLTDVKDGEDPNEIVLLCALWCGDVRLIDNAFIS